MRKSGQRNLTNHVKSDAKLTLASALLEQIKISCYTEYKAFGPFTNLQHHALTDKEAKANKWDNSEQNNNNNK